MITIEESFILIKPHAIERNLIGRIVQRIEDSGLEIERINTSIVEENIAQAHYLENQNWYVDVGQKVIETFDHYNIPVRKHLLTTSKSRIGEKIRDWSINQLTNKKVIMGIVKGPHAINRVKQIVGDTEPINSPRGTIRGDWCTDSIQLFIQT